MARPRGGSQFVLAAGPRVARGGNMATGTVKWFDSKKGFGFIAMPGDSRDIFVHFSSIEGDGFRTLADGEQVEFDLVESEKGLQAHHVKRLTPVKQKRI